MACRRHYGKQDSRGAAIKTFLTFLDKYHSPMQRGLQRYTKIVSTLGPATDSAEMIGKLIDAGVNVFRLNMSHAPHEWVRRVVKDIRAESAKRSRFTGIMMDTQ